MYSHLPCRRTAPCKTSWYRLDGGFCAIRSTDTLTWSQQQFVTRPRFCSQVSYLETPLHPHPPSRTASPFTQPVDDGKAGQLFLHAALYGKKKKRKPHQRSKLHISVGSKRSNRVESRHNNGEHTVTQADVVFTGKNYLNQWTLDVWSVLKLWWLVA